MLNLQDIIRICLFLFFAVFIFIKYRKSLVGILSVLWMLLECARQIFYRITLIRMDSIDKAELMDYFERSALILKVIDTVSILVIIIICAAAIAKVRKEKQQIRQKI